MRKLFKALQDADSNQRNYWIGLVLLFLGLTWQISLFMAMTVTGAVMIVDGVITSYIVAVINAKGP